MKRTVTGSSIGRLRTALLQELAPSSSKPGPRGPCLLCTHRILPITKPPFHATHLRYASTTTPLRHASTSTTTNPLKESLRPQTHYELFPQTLRCGPPPTGPFAVDLRQLRTEFLQLQALAHPDRHQGLDKARAEGASARINDAYKTLQDPLLRAQYLLRLRGIDVAEDETARVEDPDLLIEVLEMRERIEAAEGQEDLEPMRVDNEWRIEGSVRGLEEAFEKDGLGRAREEVIRLRYWVNVRESLRDWERGKGVVLVH